MLNYNEEPIIIKAKEIAKKAHDDVNQTYDGQPYYDAHVNEVYKWALMNIERIPIEKQILVLIAALFHDVIEDCRWTYNDLVKCFIYDIGLQKDEAYECADIVFALTNKRGKTRKERADDEYYDLIASTKYADFVKICDRLANASASKKNNGGMSNAYVKEYKGFKKKLYTHFKYAFMWYMLDVLLLSESELRMIEVGTLVRWEDVFGTGKTYVVTEIMIEQVDGVAKCYLKLRDLKSDNFEDDKYQWATVDQIRKV